MRILNNIKKRKFIKRILNKKTNLNTKIKLDNHENPNILESNYENNYLEFNNEPINNVTDCDFNNEHIIHEPINYLCLFIMLLFYYASIICTKLKHSKKK
mgnify:CR=1 FL=1